MRNRIPIHIILYTVGTSKSGQYCTGFKEISYDVMKGPKWWIGLCNGGINKISKFGVFCLFTKIGEAKREIDVRVGIKIFKFGDGVQNGLCKLRIEIGVPVY